MPNQWESSWRFDLGKEASHHIGLTDLLTQRKQGEPVHYPDHGKTVFAQLKSETPGQWPGPVAMQS